MTIEKNGNPFCHVLWARKVVSSKLLVVIVISRTKVDLSLVTSMCSCLRFYISFDMLICIRFRWRNSSLRNLSYTSLLLAIQQWKVLRGLKLSLRPFKQFLEILSSWTSPTISSISHLLRTGWRKIRRVWLADFGDNVHFTPPNSRNFVNPFFNYLQICGIFV